MECSAPFSKDKPSIPRNGLRGERGLSLLEVLIAIIILALALTSISYFFSQARGNIEVCGHMRCGLALAQDKMEELKDLGYSHDDLTVTDGDPHSDRVDSAGNIKADGEFYREWAVTSVDDLADGPGGGDMDYKLVELKVYDQRLNPGNLTLNDNDKLVAELKTYISP
jgi:prepilin-type N-terminal cleavage/methylation domain-containing protein